jgi:hypothetical protein
MVKKPSKSISGLKYFKKIVLVLGISCMLLQGIFPLTAYAAINSDELQQRTVTGRVVDASNTPMPGVNVLEKNTTNGVQTGADGRYSISVPAGAILSFSFIGYQPQEVTVGAQTVINMTLAEAVTGLDEVVVIGYGTQRKEAVTGSVSTISGNVMRDVPSANISQALCRHVYLVWIWSKPHPNRALQCKSAFEVRAR